MLGVEGVRRRLDDRLKLLGGGSGATLPRHQTLRAALEWSYALLKAEERTVFDRLGVFVGSFSLEAAQRTVSDDTIDGWAALDRLASLVDKSLVLVEASEPPRYRLLESSRAFALEHLEREGTVEALRRRHAEAIAETLAWDGRRAASIDPIMRTDGADLDNVRAAAAWATGPNGDRAIAVAVAGTAALYWYLSCSNDEGARLLATVEPWVDDPTPPLLAARFWHALSEAGLFIDLDRQERAAVKAAALYRRIGQRADAFRVSCTLSLLRSYRGNLAGAEAALAEARQLHDPSWPAWTAASLENHAGNCWFYGASDPIAARRHFQAAETLLRRASIDPGWEARSEVSLMLCDYALADYEVCVRRAHAILDHPDSPASAYTTTIVQVTLGAALVGLGRIDQAQAILRSAVSRLRRATGSSAWAFNHVSFLVARQGRIETAARLLGYADASHTAATIVRSPSMGRSYDEAVAIVERELVPADSGRLREAGRSMTEEEAIALAFPTA
jgi:tetratricopeptide (TPR) repeat protein